MKVSADRWNGRLDCGQTHEKIYQDCLNNFLKIFKNFLFIYFLFIIFYLKFLQGILFHGIKRGTGRFPSTHKGGKLLKFLTKGIYLINISLN